MAKAPVGTGFIRRKNVNLSAAGRFISSRSNHMDCRAGRLSERYRVVMYKPKKTKTEMKTGLLSLCCALMLFASCGKRIPKSDAVAIVPKPVSEQLSDSTFDLTKRTRIRLLADDSTLLRSTDFFNGVVSKAFGKGL